MPKFEVQAPHLGVQAPNIGVPGIDVEIPAPNIGVQAPGLGVPAPDKDPRLGFPDLWIQSPGVGPRCRGAGSGSGAAASRLASQAAGETGLEERGLLRCGDGGRPGSPGAGVGRGLGANRRTDRDTQ